MSKDDGRPPVRGARQARQAAQGAGSVQMRRLCPFLHSPGREDHRIARRENGRLDDDRQLRGLRHHARKSEAVRRRLPEHTTGFFLDDTDPAVTAARKKALLDFVRSGKGPRGNPRRVRFVPSIDQRTGIRRHAGHGIFGAADQNEDNSVDAQEMNGLGDKWFDMIDTAHAGKVSAQDFRAGFPRLLFSSRGPRRSGPATPPAKTGPDFQVGTWAGLQSH